MSNEELEQATMLILNTIVESKLSTYTKLELLNNLKLFFENYENNIRVLERNKKK